MWVNALSGGGVNVNADPYWASVVLLLRMEGSDGSTTFVDDKGHTVTAQGNAQIDTADFKFGTSSYLGDGTGAALTLSESTDFNGFGETDTWTIEMWAKRPTATTGVLMAFGDDAGNNYGQVNIQTFSGQQYIYLRAQGSNTLYSKANAYTYSSGWVHYAFVSTGSTKQIFVDGVEITSLSTGTSSTNNMPYGVIIGANWNAGITSSHTGWIDSVRMTKGVARYTTSFTPPTSEFPTE